MNTLFPKVMAITGLILFSAVISYILYFEVRSASLEKAVYNYLINEQGYTKDDLAIIDARYRYISGFTAHVPLLMNWMCIIVMTGQILRRMPEDFVASWLGSVNKSRERLKLVS